jgi:hypothetical protein
MAKAISKRIGLDWLELRCHHYQKVSKSTTTPLPDMEYWCKKCGSMQLVVRLLRKDEQFITICETCSNRSWGRNWGPAKHSARVQIARHMKANPEHKISLCDGDGKILPIGRLIIETETLLD